MAPAHRSGGPPGLPFHGRRIPIRPHGNSASRSDRYWLHSQYVPGPGQRVVCLAPRRPDLPRRAKRFQPELAAGNARRAALRGFADSPRRVSACGSDRGAGPLLDQRAVGLRRNAIDQAGTLPVLSGRPLAGRSGRHSGRSTIAPARCLAGPFDEYPGVRRQHGVLRPLSD